jgi:methylmalonyl-CoA/ethylmalonyl-CoA epimerase
MMDCKFFGEGARFHHIGMAVDSIRAICPDCEIFAEETQRVSLAFVQLNGITVELLEPRGENSPIARNLDKGVKLLHLCYEVPDLEATLDLCREAGFHRLGPPVPTHVFDGRRLVWVYSKQFGLFELAERDRRSDADGGADANISS